MHLASETNRSPGRRPWPGSGCCVAESEQERERKIVASTSGRMVGLRSALLTNLMKKCVALLSGRGTGDAGPVRLLFLVEESSKLPRVIIRPIGSVLSGGGCC